jgi:hypothetical protein
MHGFLEHEQTLDGQPRGSAQEAERAGIVISIIQDQVESRRRI